jgi:hypothetical protein
MVHLLSFIHGCRNRWERGIKCGSMERIYFPGSSARSTTEPELDEKSPETDAPIPSAMMTATADP